MYIDEFGTFVFAISLTAAGKKPARNDTVRYASYQIVHAVFVSELRVT